MSYDLPERLRKATGLDLDLRREAADEIELLRQQRNHWMSTARAFDEHLATFRVMLLEQPGVRFGGCAPQLDCGADRKSVASQRCRDTGGQPFDSAPITLTDAEREAVMRGMDSLAGVEDMSAGASRRDDAALITLLSLLERTK